MQQRLFMSYKKGPYYTQSEPYFSLASFLPWLTLGRRQVRQSRKAKHGLRCEAFSSKDAAWSRRGTGGGIKRIPFWSSKSVSLFPLYFSSHRRAGPILLLVITGIDWRITFFKVSPFLFFPLFFFTASFFTPFMTSLLSTWLNGSNFISEYAAVAPTSPEADASFIHHITCNTHKNNEEGENRAKRQMSKSSYVCIPPSHPILLTGLNVICASFYPSRMKTLTAHPSQNQVQIVLGMMQL